MNIFEIKGRIGRAKFANGSFLTALVSLIIIWAMFDSSTGPYLHGIITYPVFILFVAVGWAAHLCLCARRLHDLNWSGAFAFFVLIPLGAIILEPILLFKKGTQGPNNYDEYGAMVSAPPPVVPEEFDCPGCETHFAQRPPRCPVCGGEFEELPAS